jgi:hypothetical protein
MKLRYFKKKRENRKKERRKEKRKQINRFYVTISTFYDDTTSVYKRIACNIDCCIDCAFSNISSGHRE